MINIDQLAAEIGRTMQQYTESVSTAIAAKVDEVATETLQTVKATAPGTAPHQKNYAKGFKKKIVTDANGRKKVVIYNKKYPGLVHLLEFGHAKKGGGRVAGRPHILPAEQMARDELINGIEDIIRNGGR